MITKTHLQSIISKYYMEGLIDSTKWIIKDNQLIIDFISPNKNLVGKIVVDNKISYYISQLTKNEATKNYKVSYDSELLKLIMNANKEISRGKLYLSLNGIIKLEFENNDTKSTYFLIQNESY
jgi:hypothetical protein